VRNPVRKFLGVGLIGLLGVFVAAPAIAGAQTVPGEGAPPKPTTQCTFSVTPNPIPALGANVTVAGTAPAGVTVELFLGGSTDVAQTQTVAASPDPAPFSFAPFPVNTDNLQVDVNYTYGNKNFYIGGCTNVSGEVVTRITVQVAGNVTGRLAFTGSSDTPTYVLIGFGALAVGVVLVVASRRRARVHG
jgi:LPXTG-motif cell wall-anchored protein